jgi:hypothetical protein
MGFYMVRSSFAVILSISILCAGCGSVQSNGILGGAVGAGVGAGTGALVGSVIANGDVAASAVLGGAIGLPVGIALGIAYSAYDPKVQEQRLLARYVHDQEVIIAQQRDIERLRAEVFLDGARNPNYNLGVRKPFHGATLGR